MPDDVKGLTVLGAIVTAGELLGTVRAGIGVGLGGAMGATVYGGTDIMGAIETGGPDMIGAGESCGTKVMGAAESGDIGATVLGFLAPLAVIKYLE